MGLDLEAVRGIGKSTVEKMKANGFDTIEKLASTRIENLLQIKGIGKSSAIKYIEQAKKLLKEIKDKEKKEVPKIKDYSKIKQLNQKKTPFMVQKFQKRPNSRNKERKKQIQQSSHEIKKREEKAIPKTKTLNKTKKYNPKTPNYSKSFRKQPPFKKKAIKKQAQKSGNKPQIDTFFLEENKQKIRLLYSKIVKLEESLEKKDDNYRLEELNYILKYVKLLNVNFKTQSQIKILKELDIFPTFYDPIENKDIPIRDLMYECTRVLWILAKTFASLSEKFKKEKKIEDAIIAMTECSRIYKTAAYFSSACTFQEDIGLSLSAENLEIKSEEARIIAQNLVAKKEERENNLYLASQLFAGLSALSKRFYFLKKHSRKKDQHIKAQINYDIGKACYLQSKALRESSSGIDNEEYIKSLKLKSNYYFSKAEEIWENLLKNPDILSKREIDNLRVNLSIVNENIIENDVKISKYKNIQNIQNPEPFIAIPENLGLFLPKSTMHLTKYPSQDLNFNKLKEYNVSKVNFGSRYNKRENLLNIKAGIGRTIKQLKFLYDNNDIDVNKYFELIEKYEIRLEFIESSIRELSGVDKISDGDEKKSKLNKVNVPHN